METTECLFLPIEYSVFTVYDSCLTENPLPPEILCNEVGHHGVVRMFYGVA